jgi:DNA segregation ATPase FtsK/SpoIIIE-like protein
LFGKRNENEEDDEEYEDNDEYEDEDEEEEKEDEDAGEQTNFASKIIKTTIQRKSKLKQDDFPSARPRRVRAKIDIPIDLLAAEASKPNAGDIKAKQEIIRQTLANFHITVEMGDVSVGPTVTQFTLKPSEGVKLARITGLHNDLALALAAHPIRIEAPIPGKSLVGIEVPNQSVAMVRLRQIIDSKEFKNRKSNTHVALGKDVTGRPHLTDVTKLPHLLVAGSTGSGKSVCLNSIIMSLLFQNSPDELKFILIDPKRVELPVYNGLPHLLTPVITDVQKTVNSLKWAIREMDKRFDILSKVGSRDIASYNNAHQEKLPYIVIIVDELADLMVSNSSEVEAVVIRLAQMARAVGIHLVLATQRPSVDVITGLIKANIPGRIAFAVASLMDSRTILDCSGAEKLLGRGDMLYSSAELSSPKRLQGAFVNEEEIKRVVDFIKDKYDPADYDESVTEKGGLGGAVFGGDMEGDALLPDAVQVIFQAKKASASLLQRRLSIGYARAARLLDLLEEQGVIGPADGAKPRELLMSSLEQFEEMGGAVEETDEEEIPKPETEEIEEEKEEPVSGLLDDEDEDGEAEGELEDEETADEEEEEGELEDEDEESEESEEETDDEDDEDEIEDEEAEDDEDEIEEEDDEDDEKDKRGSFVPADEDEEDWGRK